jgi:hypothetical protein
MSKKRQAPKVQPEANARSPYFVAITDVDGTVMWRGVLDDANIRFSMREPQPANVIIHAKSLASYLKSKVER